MNNPWEGGSGKLGRTILYQANGKSYIRLMPSKYTDLKSPAQLAQRERVKLINSFIKPFAPVIKVTFPKEKPGRTAYQEAVSYNLLHALAGEYPDMYVDHSKVLLSKGPLPLPESYSMAAHPEGLLITWQNYPGVHDWDTLVIMAMFNSSTSTLYKFTGALRSECEYLWKLPKHLNPSQLIDAWIAFRDDLTSEMSNSGRVNYGG